MHIAEITKFMFIILSIHSKNLNSLTNFLKFFYKLKMNKTFKLKFYTIQSQQNKKFSFFSTLQSPHVNKKSQEQFEYSVHNKRLKIHVSQITKFLTTWKIVKTTLFSDIKMEIEFWVYNKPFKRIPLNKTDYDKFKLKFLNKKRLYSHENRFSKKTGCVANRKNRKILSNTIVHTSLKLLDIHGEVLIKDLFKSLDSSVGRAKDWKSLCRQFEPVSKHIKTFLWKTLYEIYLLI